MYQQYRCEIMANSRQEVTLKVDWEIIDASKGYAIDIGEYTVSRLFRLFTITPCKSSLVRRLPRVSSHQYQLGKALCHVCQVVNTPRPVWLACLVSIGMMTNMA